MITKTDFDGKLLSLNRITKNKIDYLLVQNELNKLKTFDSSYFVDKSQFEEDGRQNYLVFQPIIMYFKVNRIANTDYVSSWKCKTNLLKVLNHLLHLIIVLPQHKIMALKQFNGSC